MKEEEQTTLNEEVTINVDGKSETTFEKILVKEGEHNGVIMTFTKQETTKFDSNAKEMQIVASVQLEGDVGEIPFFIKPKITKSWKEGFSNSKLYDVLETAGELKNAIAGAKDLGTVDDLVEFLEKKLAGKKIRFSTKTVNKGKKDDEGVSLEYSRVQEIYEFLK